MSEFTTFIKYLVIPSGFLKDIFAGIKDLLHPKRLSILFILLSILSFFFLRYNRRIISGFFLLLALIMLLRIIYKAGDHNKWNKDRIKLHARQNKKEKDLPLGNSLGTQNTTGEEDLQRDMPDGVDNHSADELNEEKEDGTRD